MTDSERIPNELAKNVEDIHRAEVRPTAEVWEPIDLDRARQLLDYESTLDVQERAELFFMALRALDQLTRFEKPDA